MINIELIQKTAESLMAKAAIEIPDDYLTGLQKAANDEDGDLSSFVLEAMLENYVAAMEEVMRAKPSSSKGRYVKKATISTTMGPGIQVDPNIVRESAGN